MGPVREERVLLKDLPPEIVSAATATLNYYQMVYQFERQLVRDSLRRSNYKYKAAANILGLNPKGMHRLVKRLDLSDLLR